MFGSDIEPLPPPTDKPTGFSLQRNPTALAIALAKNLLAGLDLSGD
jgi:hypothetical protein